MSKSINKVQDAADLAALDGLERSMKDAQAPKYCVNCKWHKHHDGFSVYCAVVPPWDQCRCPELGNDLVTGVSIYRRCKEMREDRLSLAPRCGPEARWFSPKNERSALAGDKVAGDGAT